MEEVTWEVNIKINPQETRWEDMEWINLAKNRDKWQVFVNMVINHWVL
jgi:hypothetical protein